MSNRKNILNIGAVIYAVLSFGYISYMFADFNMSNFGNFAIFTVLGLYCLIKDGIFKKTSLANDFLLWIAALLFSATVVTGYHFTNETAITLKVLVLFAFAIGGLTFVYKCLFVKIYTIFEGWAKKQSASNKPADINKKKVWLTAFVVIMCCWSIVWLAYYPGFINYDHEQIMQVINGEYTTHHPLIHTLMFGGIYVLGLKLGNATVGVILYAFIQMSIMASIMAYSFVYVVENINSKAFRVLVLAFYGLLPVNSILAMSTTKDVIFSGLVLLAVVLLEKYNKEDGSKIKGFLLMGTTVLMLLFRNNAFYALALMFVLAVCFVKLQKNGLKIVLAILVCLVVYKGCDKILVSALDAESGSIGEMLSVPTMQFGRVYLTAEELGDTDTMQLVERFYDMDKAIYRQRISDMMKKYIRNVDTTEGLVEYLKTSLELFKRYPLVSVQSVVYLTQGHWDINDISHAEIYGTKAGDRFGYLTTRVYENYGVTTESKIPVLEKLLEEAFTANKYQYVPVITLLFAPAFYLWFLVLYTIFMIRAKKWNNLFLSSFFWFYILTLLAGPCVLIRYIYPLIVSTPVLIITMLNTVSERNAEK